MKAWRIWRSALVVFRQYTTKSGSAVFIGSGRRGRDKPGNRETTRNQNRSEETIGRSSPATSQHAKFNKMLPVCDLTGDDTIDLTIDDDSEANEQQSGRTSNAFSEVFYETGIYKQVNMFEGRIYD